MLAGAGDELQGIKRGIMEMADAVAITKADGTNANAARQARQTYQNALHLMAATESGWQPPVQICSALTGTGITEVWQLMEKYLHLTRANGYFARKRQVQNRQWLHETIRQELEEKFYRNPLVKSRLKDIEANVESGGMAALEAARILLQSYFGKEDA